MKYHEGAALYHMLHRLRPYRKSTNQQKTKASESKAKNLYNPPAVLAWCSGQSEWRDSLGIAQMGGGLFHA